MQRESFSAARSSCSCDHCAHCGSSSITSRMTLVSTRIKIRLAPRESQDFARTHLHRCGSSQLGEPALPRLCATHRYEYRFALRAQFELDGTTGTDTQRIAHAFGNRDLPFARDPTAHGLLVK